MQLESVFSPSILSVSKALSVEAVLVVAIAAGVSEGLPPHAIAFACEIDPDVCADIAAEIEKAGMAPSGKLLKKSSPKRSACDKVLMDPKWKLPAADVEYARRWGFTDDEIRIEAIDFRDYWLQRGEKRNWSLTWQNRIRQSARRLGKPAPSDEPPAVTELPLAPAAPKNAAMLRDAMAAYSKSNFWPSSLGPEPGQPGCVVPKEIIAEFRGAA